MLEIGTNRTMNQKNQKFGWLWFGLRPSSGDPVLMKQKEATLPPQHSVLAKQMPASPFPTALVAFLPGLAAAASTAVARPLIMPPS